MSNKTELSRLRQALENVSPEKKWSVTCESTDGLQREEQSFGRIPGDMSDPMVSFLRFVVQCASFEKCFYHWTRSGGAPGETMAKGVPATDSLTLAAIMLAGWKAKDVQLSENGQKFVVLELRQGALDEGLKSSGSIHYLPAEVFAPTESEFAKRLFVSEAESLSEKVIPVANLKEFLSGRSDVTLVPCSK